MIIDITGKILTPGNEGKHCAGNGYACNECDYLLCCAEMKDLEECKNCTDQSCPHSPVCRPAWKEILPWLKFWLAWKLR